VSAPLNRQTETDVDCSVLSGHRRHRRLRNLRKAIETSYATMLQAIPFQGLTIELLRVADVDTLLDRLPTVQYRPDERLPYWADLWPSSLALARYLWETVDVQGLQTLELGCGLGLAGVVASRKGAQVTFTDYEADALSFTRYNILQNACVDAKVRYLDWHAPDLCHTYGLVIASDLFYERANFAPLLHLLHVALAPAGQFILTEPNRPIGRDFFRMLRDHGFQYERATARLTVDGEDHTVSIYHGSHKTTVPSELNADVIRRPPRLHKPNTS
jgi:predicted nicotinamide N-methyase